MPQDSRVDVGKISLKNKAMWATFRRELLKMERSSLPAIGVRCPPTGTRLDSGTGHTVIR